MNLHEHFLPQDLESASREFKCFKDCLKIVTTSVDKGNMEKATKYTHEMLRSLQVMARLNGKKTSIVRNRHLLNGMHTVAHIELTRLMRNE